MPLSFSEKQYQHQVITFSLENGQINHIQGVPLPQHTSLISIPATHQSPQEVLKALTSHPDNPTEPAPFLEVKVLLNEPTPELKYSITQALAHKHLRLARIDVRYRQEKSAAQAPFQKELTLHDLQPYEVLQRVYQNKYKEELPEYYRELFNEAMLKINS